MADSQAPAGTDLERVDLVLSEVHIGAPGASGVEDSGVITRLKVLDTCEDSELPPSAPNKRLRYDEDGDVELRRPRPGAAAEYLTITHSMATPIRDVGLQLWLGAFLLCDFVLHFSTCFTDVGALELGCGPGLVGIALARFAAPKPLFVTDAFEKVLILAQQNLELNAGRDSGRVLRLDWTHELRQSATGDMFGWTGADIADLDKVEYLFASDVIYDDSLVDALFLRLRTLLTGGKVLYMAMEKRYNFSLEELKVAANGYTRFCSHVHVVSPAGGVDPQELMRGVGSGTSSTNIQGGITPEPGKFIAQQIRADFPQRFEYQRTKDLELWRIEPPPVGTEVPAAR
jgi:predicted nicotinamide N-methyase